MALLSTKKSYIVEAIRDHSQTVFKVAVQSSLTSMTSAGLSSTSNTFKALLYNT